MFDEELVTEQPLKESYQKVFIAAFALLTSLAIRDTFTKQIEHWAGSDATKSLRFTWMFLLLVLLITSILVVVFYVY
jgi:hypothetical protein